MSTTTSTPPSVERLLPRAIERERRVAPAVPRFGPAWPDRLLVASDGSLSSDAAVIAARTFAERSGASVEMIAIYSPRVPLPTEPEGQRFARWERSDRDAVANLLADVRRQQSRLLRRVRERREWILRLEIGHPGATIVRVSKETSPDLIVLGAGTRDPVVAPYTAQTTRFTTRYVTVPVFAAAAGAESPIRCVVAFPDGEAHAPTIRAAVGSLGLGARIWFALPARSKAAHHDDAAMSRTVDQAIAEAFGEDLAARVATMEIGRVELGGDMLSGVLELIEDVSAELVAVHNVGDPGPVRVFLPNLAEPLLVGARCSVLVVPDPLP